MKIGDRCFVHGYVDEIRKDTVIIRNSGGYFGTDPSEVTATFDTERTGKWIPVSERAPEHGGWFIVTKDGAGGDKHVFLSYFSTAHGWEFAEEPIAWMPLPEPYREEGESR